MQRCQRCIMPAIPDVISLDSDGICRPCREHRPFPLRGEEALLGLLKPHRVRPDRYDGIVTVSGGRDSAFTLLKLVKDYRMKILAVNYENPFADGQARVNIDRMVEILGVDLVRFRLPGDLHRRMLRNKLLAWLHKPSVAMVPVICIGCKIIWPSIMAIAREHRVDCIISGGNPYEYTSFKRVLLGLHPDASLASTYMLNAFRLAKESLDNLPYLNPAYLPYTVKGYLFSNPYAFGSRLLGKRLNKIDLFHYIPWDEQKVLSRIQDELGWRPPPRSPSTWRFDCRLSHLKDLMYLITLGITERDDFYSRLVRDGKLSREDALHRIAMENEVDRAAIDQIFEQLGITDTDGWRRLRAIESGSKRRSCPPKNPRN